MGLREPRRSADRTGRSADRTGVLDVGGGASEEDSRVPPRQGPSDDVYPSAAAEALIFAAITRER